MIGKEFTLKHVFEKFPKISEKYSPKEEHFGMRWGLCIEKKEENLAVYLHCCKDIGETSSWSIDADYTFSITSGSEKEKLKHTVVHTFVEIEGYGTHEFAPWNDVITKYMTDNAVSVECRVTINKMIGFSPKKVVDFDGMSEHLTDVVLKVGEQKFRVSKTLLAFHSPYFDKLFFGDFSESKDSEVELKEVDPNDFQSLLDVIYVYADSAIQGENVEGLLKLADRFDVKLVRDKCEKFLQKHEAIDKKMKLRLGDWYDLKDLKKSCLESIKSLDEMKSFVPADVAELTHETLVVLLQKCLSQYQ